MKEACGGEVGDLLAARNRVLGNDGGDASLGHGLGEQHGGELVFYPPFIDAGRALEHLDIICKGGCLLEDLAGALGPIAQGQDQDPCCPKL